MMDEQQIHEAEQRLVQVVNAFDLSNIAVPTTQYVEAVSALLLFGQLEKMDRLLWKLLDEVEDLREDLEEDDAEDVREAKLVTGDPREGRIPFAVVQEESK